MNATQVLPVVAVDDMRVLRLRSFSKGYGTHTQSNA